MRADNPGNRGNPVVQTVRVRLRVCVLGYSAIESGSCGWFLSSRPQTHPVPLLYLGPYILKKDTKFGRWIVANEIIKKKQRLRNIVGDTKDARGEIDRCPRWRLG